MSIIIADLVKWLTDLGENHGYGSIDADVVDECMKTKIDTNIYIKKLIN
jgi:hypothetical protein